MVRRKIINRLSSPVIAGLVTRSRKLLELRFSETLTRHENNGQVYSKDSKGQTYATPLEPKHLTADLKALKEQLETLAEIQNLCTPAQKKEQE